MSAITLRKAINRLPDWAKHYANDVTTVDHLYSVVGTAFDNWRKDNSSMTRLQAMELCTWLGQLHPDNRPSTR